MGKFAYTHVSLLVYMYVFTHMYICVCAYAYVYVHAPVCMCIHIYTYEMIVFVGVACKHHFRFYFPVNNGICRVSPKSATKGFFYSLSWRRVVQGLIKAGLQVSNE